MTKPVEVITEGGNHQHRLTVRKDGVTIKVAKGTQEEQRNKVIQYLIDVARKHADTIVTLRGSTNKVQLGISLFNDSRTQCFHHEGSFA